MSFCLIQELSLLSVPGLDPQSAEHLQTLIEEIKDEMLKQKSVQFVIITVVVVVVVTISN